MKTLALGITVMFFGLLASTAHAQCGCSGGYAMPMASPAMPMPYSPPMAGATRGPAGVAYVNSLAQPVNRGSYSLMYAIHLTDGRILLTDFLPSGHSVQGVEVAPPGGRRVSGLTTRNGAVMIKDPTTNQVISSFAIMR